MIRREIGSEYFLVTQDDHAEVSAKVAGHWGNATFPRPEPWPAVLTAVRQHDAGWPLHDGEPTLDENGRPLDVFETPWQIALKVWLASVQRAVEIDPYAGFLVSLHVLSLSGQVRIDDLAARFQLNKFQHREVERQEKLRPELGLSTDLPLTLGLAASGTSAGEDRLAFNFRFLQLMDLISLQLCCDDPPEAKGRGEALRIELERDAAGVVHVRPWPFDVERIEVEVPYRSVPAKVYTDEEFQLKYRAAKIEYFTGIVAG